MGGASILDLWKAFGVNVNQAAGLAQEGHIQEYNNSFATIQTNVNNWIRDNPYKGGVDEFDDDRAFNDYLTDLNYVIDEQYGLAGKNRRFLEFQDMLKESRTRNREIARDTALRKQDEWRISRENVSLSEDIQKYLDSDFTPIEKLSFSYNRIDLHGIRNGLTPERRSAMRGAVEVDVYQQAVMKCLRQVNDVNELDTAMGQIRDVFNNNMPKTTLNLYDENGGVTGTKETPWGYAGRDEWEKELIKNETAKIQGKHYEEYREKQSYFQRLIVSGEIEQAILFAKQYGPEWNKYYDPSNREYANSNRDYRDRGENWFDYRTLEGYLAQGLSTDAIKVMSLLDAYNLSMFLRPQFDRGSDGSVIVGYNEDGSPITVRYDSVKEAFQGFLYYKREAYFRDNGDDYMTRQLWNAEQEKFFVNFYNEVGTALRQINPELGRDFDRFMNFNTYLEGGDYYNPDIRNFSEFAKNSHAERSTDFFLSILFSGTNDAPTIRQAMRDFTGSEILSLLTYRGTQTNDGDTLRQLKAFSDKAMSGDAEDIIFIMHNPDTYRTTGQGTSPIYLFRSSDLEQAVNKQVEEERRRVAGILDLGVNNLMPSWMPSERRSGDVIPKGMFVIQSGQHAGTYYLDYDDNANPIVMRRTNSGGWTEYRRDTRQLTPTEQREQQRRVENEYRQTVYNDRHPFTGNAFNAQLRPPPGSGITQAAWQSRGTDVFATWGNYFHELENNPSMIDSIVARGINPFDGAALIIDRQPAPGHEREWNTLSNERRVQLWANEFKSRLPRR